MWQWLWYILQVSKRINDVDFSVKSNRSSATGIQRSKCKHWHFISCFWSYEFSGVVCIARKSTLKICKPEEVYFAWIFDFISLFDEQIGSVVDAADIGAQQGGHFMLSHFELPIRLNHCVYVT